MALIQNIHQRKILVGLLVRNSILCSILTIMVYVTLIIFVTQSFSNLIISIGFMMLLGGVAGNKLSLSFESFIQNYSIHGG